MEKNIAVIWGDCSSPEIVKQTIRVLDKVAEKYGHTFHYTNAAMGGEAIDKYGDPLPQHELDKCLAADSVLLGAVGGPKWEGLPGEQRPEKGLLRLRAGMGLYSNNRPAKIWPQLAPASPLKPEIVAQGIDFIIVRELIGGVYFGNHETHTLASGEKQAIDSMPYSEHEIERIGRIGFETARKRRKKLCCVDKANVLDTSRLWRSVMHRLQAEYPDVEYSEMFVDNCAMQIVKQTIRVLYKVAEKYGHTFHYTDAAMGGEAIDKYGDPLPQQELAKCLAADSVLLGAVGGPKWEGLPGEQRPEKGLLRLRAGMGLYSNNRPAKIWPQLAPASPLKPEIVAQGIDFIIVRELIGGVYFGNHETHTLENGEKQAIDSMPYSEHEIERIGRIGFETAQKRRKKLCCVDKANVLDTSRLWRSVMHRLQAEYPDVEYSEMFVDNCAMQIVKNPAQFDVIVTENMFGDILSDEASMITGSIGMIPSSSLGDGTRGLYEPIHGSAPDIAGKGIVNPTACILSAAMMLRYSFGMTEEADAIENAVNKVLDKGLRTADNMSEGCTCLGCTAMGDAILAEI